MTKYIILAAICLSAAGCTGSSDEPTAKNTSVNGKPAATVQNANASEQVQTTTNAANNGNAIVNPIAIARNKKIEEMRKAGSDPNVPKLSIEEMLTQSTRPAPEDSQFSVALADILVERRTFLKNPLLSKVEKTTNGQNRSIKVFLKDGQVIDLPGEAIQNLSTASSESIIRAARIKTAPSETKLRGSEKN